MAKRQLIASPQPLRERVRSFSGLQSPPQRIATPSKRPLFLEDESGVLDSEDVKLNSFPSMSQQEDETITGEHSGITNNNNNNINNNDDDDDDDSQSIASERKWSLDDFVMGKPLGRGKFGNVYLAQEKASSVVIALKVVSKSSLSEEMIFHLKREVEIQSRLNHCNILKLLGFFHNLKSSFLILEYASTGDLFRQIQLNGGGMDEAASARYMLQLVKAVQHLHERYIIHRDVKPENVLLGIDGEVKLCDFGGAIHAPPPYHKRQTMCGTPEYLAPEVLSNVPYDNTIDLWALGVLCYELLVGSTPFNDLTSADPDLKTKKIYAKILAFKSPVLFPTSSSSSSRRVSSQQGISETAIEFTGSLMHSTPSKRATARTASQHTWLSWIASSPTQKLNRFQAKTIEK